MPRPDPLDLGRTILSLVDRARIGQQRAARKDWNGTLSNHFSGHITKH